MAGLWHSGRERDHANWTAASIDDLQRRGSHDRTGYRGCLAQRTRFLQDDVRVCFGDGGIDKSAVARPRNTPGDYDGTIAEIGRPMHRAVLGVDEPEIRGRAVDQRLHKPLAIRRQDRVDVDVLHGDSRAVDARQGRRRAVLGLGFPEVPFRQATRAADWNRKIQSAIYSDGGCRGVVGSHGHSLTTVDVNPLDAKRVAAHAGQPLAVW